MSAQNSGSESSSTQTISAPQNGEEGTITQGGTTGTDQM